MHRATDPAFSTMRQYSLRIAGTAVNSPVLHPWYQVIHNFRFHSILGFRVISLFNVIRIFSCYSKPIWLGQSASPV